MSVDENEAAIQKRAGKELKAIAQDVLPVILQSGKSKNKKFIWLQNITSKALDLISPNIPCKKGCSYCCHVAVSISRTEAKAIQDYTGRTMVELKRPTLMQDPDGSSLRSHVNAKKYWTKPCPLLSKEGECTVYPARPLPCRTFHVIEDTSEPCRQMFNSSYDGEGKTYMYDMQAFEMAATAVFLDEVWADIREWFPDEN